MNMNTMFQRTGAVLGKYYMEGLLISGSIAKS
jgi:hypothetical protein